jgi:hypothetical protein
VELQAQLKIQITAVLLKELEERVVFLTIINLSGIILKQSLKN